MPSRQDVERCVYLKRWKQNEKAVVLKTSNNLVQIIYADRCEVVLQFATETATVVSKDVKNVPFATFEVLEA